MPELPTQNTGNCVTCGRVLKDYRTCAPDDPAMDCGGDCLACMREWESDEPQNLSVSDQIKGLRLFWKVTRRDWTLGLRLRAVLQIIRYGDWRADR
jgi:hypothetical protein